jgi:hypothetical protein
MKKWYKMFSTNSAFSVEITYYNCESVVLYHGRERGLTLKINNVRKRNSILKQSSNMRPLDKEEMNAIFQYGEEGVKCFARSLNERTQHSEK